MKNLPNIKNVVEVLGKKPRMTVLTGAGISAESGIPTFRGKDGLWMHHKAEELATPEAFARNPKLVWEWYNWRRGIIGSKKPNAAHEVLAKWEKIFPQFSLITQNIDGLHEKAGSSSILELHGNIWKLRCTEEGTVREDKSLSLRHIPPRCPECGALLRPHVVWFGESLDRTVLEEAYRLISNTEVMLVAGTSAIVQPAASLPLAALQSGAKIVEVNPEPTPLTSYVDFSFRGKAGEILPLIDRELEKTLLKKRNKRA